MKKETIKILILTANPQGTDLLSLGVEVRKIEEALQRAKNRDRFEIITRSAVRTIDLHRALLEHRPQIVHFSGHGAETHGLVLENDEGKIQFVSTQALARLFGAFEIGVIECVLLNACYSEVQADAIHQFVDCVIGMQLPIGDKAAIRFAEGFYDALGAGSSYEEAYKLGCSAIDLDGSFEYSTPTIKSRKRGTNSQKNASMPVSSNASIEESPNKNSQSYSMADISIGSGDNGISFLQGNNNSVQFSQNTSQASGQNTDLQAALDALAKLKQQIAAVDVLNPMQKRMMVEIPIKTIEAELPKSPVNKQSIGEAVETLKQGLEGIPILAEPVAKVALLVEKVRVD